MFDVNNAWHTLLLQQKVSVIEESRLISLCLAKLVLSHIDPICMVEDTFRCICIAVAETAGHQKNAPLQQFKCIVYTGTTALGNMKRMRNINTLSPRQNCRHFVDDIWKRILLNEIA